MKNYWGARKDVYVEWMARFPAPDMVDDSEIEKWGGFVRKFLALTNQLNILRPYAMRGGIPFDAEALIISLRGESEGTPIIQTGELEFLHTSSRMAYFDAQGEVAEVDARSTKAIVLAFDPKYEWLPAGDRPFQSEPLGMGVWDIWPKREGLSNRWLIVIRSHTDIWFPWVLGFRSVDPIDEHSRYWNRWLDNRPLAARHTPRLNQFLGTLRQWTLEYGGEWSMGDENFVHYQPMIHETGIHIDWMPPEAME